MSTPPLAGLATGLVLLAVVGAAAAAPAVKDQVLDDLLFELQMVPLDGQPAPPFTLERVGDGKKISLAEHRGRPVLLYFWASW